MALPSCIASSCWYFLQLGVEPHGSLLPLHLSLTALVVCRSYSNKHSGCGFRTGVVTPCPEGSISQHFTTLLLLHCFLTPLFMMLPNSLGRNCVLVSHLRFYILNLHFDQPYISILTTSYCKALWPKWRPAQIHWCEQKALEDSFGSRSFCKIVVLTLGCKTITPAWVLDQMYSTKHAFPPMKQNSVKAESCWSPP